MGEQSVRGAFRGAVSWGSSQLGEQSVRGAVSWGSSQLGEHSGEQSVRGAVSEGSTRGREGGREGYFVPFCVLPWF